MSVIGLLILFFVFIHYLINYQFLVIELQT